MGMNYSMDSDGILANAGLINAKNMRLSFPRDQLWPGTFHHVCLFYRQGNEALGRGVLA